MAKVTSVSCDGIVFDDGSRLESNHESNCCESHYLDFSQVSLGDFDGLEFDLSSTAVVQKVEGYGIELRPVLGFPVRVPGYGFNNGYYSTDLEVILRASGGRALWRLDITECQVISD